MDTLTARERFLRSMAYRSVDRVPYRQPGMWPQTLERWLQEGMPWIEKAENLVGASGLYPGCQYFGFDRWDFIDIKLNAQPPYPETVLEESDRYRIYVDAEGSTRKELRGKASHGGQMSMDTFVDFPAKNRTSWAKFKKCFDPQTGARFPKWWKDLAKIWKQRDYPLVLPLNSERAFGLYSWLRRCMGTVDACTIFFDDPAFAEELLDFYTDFTIDTIHHALHDVDIDCFNIFEDMAGKGGPLLSPNVFKKYLVPRYKRLVEFLRRHNVAYISMDSDGDMRPLIPLLLEMGIDVLWPIEVAAGMEPVELRKEYGRDLRMWGGIDKRELTKGRKEIVHEVLRKVPQLVEDGGYLPHLDHDIPPDIPYDNFLYYLEVLHRACEGRYGA